jgi:hypothetical protein
MPKEPHPEHQRTRVPQTPIGGATEHPAKDERDEGHEVHEGSFTFR